jgi:phosphopantetheinyl transferase
MAALTDFHYLVAGPPGVEVVVGHLDSTGPASKGIGEMRELGRACAREAAQRLSGEKQGELTYSELGAPLWAGGAKETYISISHTGQCAIGVASHSRVGVDVEFVSRDVSRLLKSFTPVEQELSTVVSPIALLCAKEAAGKSVGVGLAGSITRWSVIAFEADVKSLLVRDLQTGDYWRVWISVIESGNQALQCAVAQGTKPATKELLEMYESSQVEMRPIGSQSWQEGTAAVRSRAMDGVMITAWNPGPERPSIEENNKANELLFNRLKTYCSDIWEADGFSPDHNHREPGFMAWAMKPEIGLQIAREVGQFAIFYFEASGTRVLLSV